MPPLRLLFAGLLIVLPAIAAGAEKVPPGRAVVGYVFPQDAALQPGQVDPSSMTRINYAFANIVDGRMVTALQQTHKTSSISSASSARTHH